MFKILNTYFGDKIVSNAREQSPEDDDIITEITI